MELSYDFLEWSGKHSPSARETTCPISARALALLKLRPLIECLPIVINRLQIVDATLMPHVDSFDESILS